MALADAPATPAPADTWTYLDGKLVRYDQARIGLLTHALHYGTACFEGLRAYWNPDLGQLFVRQALRHFERLERSAAFLGMTLPADARGLAALTVELLRRNEIRADAYIRPILFTSSEVLNPAMDGLAQSFAVYVTPFGRHADATIGTRCMISSVRKIPRDSIPSGAKITGTYVNSALAKAEARRKGFDEAIQLTGEGKVSEASIANLFMYRDGAMATPPLRDGILAGITRHCLMRLIPAELGIEVIERSIDPSELYGCDELLLCGTGTEVLAVSEVDSRRVGDGRVGRLTARLQQEYRQAVRGYLPRYQDWLTAVYEGAESPT
jgi:branched-chain amino acid aminotransferase